MTRKNLRLVRQRLIGVEERTAARAQARKQRLREHLQRKADGTAKTYHISGRAA